MDTSICGYSTGEHDGSPDGMGSVRHTQVDGMNLGKSLGQFMAG